MRDIVDNLRTWGFSICTTFLLDTTFCLDADKFLAASLTTLSTMVSLETPAVNVLTKMDLLTPEDRNTLDSFLDGDIKSVLTDPEIASSSISSVFIVIKFKSLKVNILQASCNNQLSQWNSKHRKLTEAIGSILEDYSLVKFVPLETEDEDSISELLLIIDTTIQYGEDLDTKDTYPEDEDPDEQDQ